VWQQLHAALLDELGRADGIDWSRVCLDSLSVRAKRGRRADGPQPDRPRQARLQVSSGRRPAGHPAGGGVIGGQLPRRAAAGSHGGCDPAGQGAAGPSRPAPQTPRQAARRQSLRLRTLPAGIAPTGHHAQDRPARDRAQREARPLSMGGGAVAGLTGRLPPPRGALRAARRPAPSVPAPSLRAGLRAPPPPCPPSGIANGCRHGAKGRRPLFNKQSTGVPSACVTLHPPRSADATGRRPSQATTSS
jgi:hypothetical protein